jgi:hypothetical protein
MNKQEKIDQDQTKALVVEQLKKTPIVQVVCEKFNIGRSTFYRWKQESKDFNKAVDEAVKEGTEYLCDLSEGQLVSAIKDKNLRAIIFYLKSNSTKYATKVELNGKLKVETKPLSTKEKELIKKALSLSGLINNKQ